MSVVHMPLKQSTFCRAGVRTGFLPFPNSLDWKLGQN